MQVGLMERRGGNYGSGVSPLSTRTIRLWRWGSTPVAEAGGGHAKEDILRRPLGRSDGGYEKNANNVPLRYLQRDSDDGGPLGPLRSSDNAATLTDSYSF